MLNTGAGRRLPRSVLAALGLAACALALNSGGLTGSGAVFVDTATAGGNHTEAAVLAGPTGLQVAGGSGKVSLAWNPASTPCSVAQAHQVVTRDGPTIATLGPTATAYDDSAAAVGTHTYKVQTTCAGWMSSDQATGTGTSGLPMPSVTPGKVLLSPTYGGSGTVPPALNSGVVAIAGSAGWGDLALLSTGAVYAWTQYSTTGYTIDSVPTPAQSGVVAIAVAGQYDMALKQDGSVFVWYGANPTTTYSVPAAASSGVVQIAAVVGSTSAEAAFAALKSDGSVVFWGILDGSNWTYPATPAVLTSGVAAVYGQDYSGAPGFYALTTGGALYNVSGSTATAVTIPPVATMSAAGGTRYGAFSATAALLKDGTVQTISSNTGSAGTLPACASKALGLVVDGDWGTNYTWRLCDDGTLLDHQVSYNSTTKVTTTSNYAYSAPVPGHLTKLMASNAYVMTLFDNGTLNLLSSGSAAQTWSSVADVVEGDQGWLILQSP